MTQVPMDRFETSSVSFPVEPACGSFPREEPCPLIIACNAFSSGGVTS